MQTVKPQTSFKNHSLETILNCVLNCLYVTVCLSMFISVFFLSFFPSKAVFFSDRSSRTVSQKLRSTITVCSGGSLRSCNFSVFFLSRASSAESLASSDCHRRQSWVLLPLRCMFLQCVLGPRRLYRSKFSTEVSY